MSAKLRRHLCIEFSLAAGLLCGCLASEALEHYLHARGEGAGNSTAALHPSPARTDSSPIR